MSVELLEGISCKNCPGAECCHDIELSLTDEEARGLRKAKSKLKLLGLAGERRGSRKIFLLEGRCGNSKQDAHGHSFCVVHGTEAQPLVCGAGMVEGGVVCQARRLLAVPILKD